MRIVQMIDSLSWGGAQKMQLFLAESLVPLGIELTVVSLQDVDDSPVAEMLRETGVRVVAFPFPKLFSLISFGKVVHFLREEKFDILHAYLTYSNIIGSLAGKLSGTPTIASLRSADFGYENYSRQRVWMENMSMRFFATRVMANGAAVAQFARQRLKDSRPVDIIVNAVDIYPPLARAEREALRAEVCGVSNRPIILSVGRLTEAKGFHDLVDAFALVHARAGCESAVLVIAGGGVLMEELATQVRQLKLEEQVFLLGQREDVTQLLEAADLYVNSSHWEGTPVSVLEAMACGLAVVATSVGESPNLLEQGRAGLLVSPGQPQELAVAVISLLDSPEKGHEFGQAARKRVEQYYSRATWTRKLLELYAQLSPKAEQYLTKANVAVNASPDINRVLQLSED